MIKIRINSFFKRQSYFILRKVTNWYLKTLMIIVLFSAQANCQSMKNIKITEERIEKSGSYFCYEPNTGFIINKKLSAVLYSLYSFTNYSWVDKADINLNKDPKLRIVAQTIDSPDIGASELIDSLTKRFNININRKRLVDTFWVLETPRKIPLTILHIENHLSPQRNSIKNNRILYENRTLKDIIRHLQYHHNKKIICIEPDAAIWKSKVNMEIPLEIFDSEEAFRDYFLDLNVDFFREEREYLRISLSNN